MAFLMVKFFVIIKFFISSFKCDLLFLISLLSTLLNKEINPLIFSENEFKKALKIKEAAIVSILDPSQRLIITGKEYFLKFIM